MSFRLFSDAEIRSSIKERNNREKVNAEVGGEAYVKCRHCEGSGVKHYSWGQLNENTGWNGEFCETCGGTGYIDWVEAIMKGIRV